MSNFSEMSKSIISDYAREFGERKLNRIFERIKNSTKVKQFIEHAKVHRYVPTSQVLVLIFDIPWFSFARGQTLLVATTFVILLWDEECNSNDELIDDFSLGVKMREVYREIGQTSF